MFSFRCLTRSRFDLNVLTRANALVVTTEKTQRKSFPDVRDWEWVNPKAYPPTKNNLLDVFF